MQTQGFTLVEILVAVALASLVLGAVYLVYDSQQNAFYAQAQVAELQQNLRTAIGLLERDLRLAGCDPTGNAGAGFTATGPSSVTFSMDIRGDAEGSDADGDTGDASETVTYALSDGDGDGDQDLLRNGQILAENVDSFDLVYLDSAGAVLDDDGNGNVITHLEEIQAVEVAMVVRSAKADRQYTDGQAYTNLQGQTILAAQNDHFRRKILRTRVTCRNQSI